MIAEVIVRPCAGIAEGSWEWWLKGCWMLRADVAWSLTLALVVAALIWSAHQSRRQAA